MSATTLSGPAAAAAAASGVRPASADRRFYAFVLDRLVGWSLVAVAGAGAYSWFLRDERWVPGIAVVVGALVLVDLLSSLLVGLWGVSVGKAALGLRVLSVDGGLPVGVVAALLRTAVLGVATLPTFGFGTAALAWTAVADPSGRRRGWHDVVSGSVVVDVRPEPVPEPTTDERPPPVVNLTAARLVPPAPPTRPAALPPPPDLDATAAVSPRQGLGWPLVGRPPSAGWRVSFDTGETLVVEGLVLVGRRPEPRAGEPVHTLLALPSSDMSLSKTHAQFQVVPDGALVVMDRGSTNGSVLIRGGLFKHLDGGRPATLKDGDRVRFGDREMAVSRVDVGQ